MGNQSLQVDEEQTILLPKDKGQTIVYKALHRKLQNEKLEVHEHMGVN